MSIHSKGSRFLTAISFLLLLPAANAATYSFTTLQYPGALGTYPLSINTSGTIAGYFFDSSYGAHGFVYSGGTFTQIDGGSTCGSTFVTGINDAGTLSGYCFPSQGGTLSFTGTSGAFTYFSLPGILDSYAEGINNKNISVGWYFTNANTIASFHAANGKVGGEFAAPGSVATAAYGINNSNVIVGNGIPSGAAYQQGFISHRGTFTFVSYPSSYETFFNGLNDSLQIVGDENKVARGPVTAFLYANGKFTDLLVPNAARSIAWGINNSSVIVGYYVTGSGNIEINATGFIGTPQP